jgi:hypothetical protein
MRTGQQKFLLSSRDANFSEPIYSECVFQLQKGILGFLKPTKRLGLIEKHLGKTLGLGETFYHLGKHWLIESFGHGERFGKRVELEKL